MFRTQTFTIPSFAGAVKQHPDGAVQDERRKPAQPLVIDDHTLLS